MNILVIGGTGHIGSYLVPRLLAAGHQVQVVARNRKPRYGDPEAWNRASWITADRKTEEQSDAWLDRMKQLDPDVVVDLICFTATQNRVMIDAFKGRVRHFLHCGTLWAYGPATRKPFLESYPRRPITEYGERKVQIESDLLAACRDDGFPATVVHPGHISGKEWLPIDPQGTIEGVTIYEKLAGGEEVTLPDTGLATLHHVHADDVAQIFEKAIANPDTAIGESFSAAAPYALSLVGCCECVAALFNAKPNLAFLPLEKMTSVVSEASFANIKTHVEHSPCASIDKACKKLGHEPGYTTEQIYEEVIEHLLETKQLSLDEDT